MQSGGFEMEKTVDPTKEIGENVMITDLLIFNSKRFYFHCLFSNYGQQLALIKDLGGSNIGDVVLQKQQ